MLPNYFLCFIIFWTIFFYEEGYGQIKCLKKERVYVFGNCNMCKKRIEKSVFRKKVSSGIWNQGTKMLEVNFDSSKTNVQKLMIKVADGGYDNRLYFAPDEIYAKLPECCKYIRPFRKELFFIDTILDKP